MIVTSGFRHRALVVALAGIYGMGPQWAHANPTGAQVVNGQAFLQAQDNKLTVTNTPGAIINWQSFSVGAGETTYFQQQNAASAVLNRVQAQNPSLKSQIDGTLGSNGRVFLINPNGIVFGAGSVVDTQGFVASTLNLNDADFKAGKLKFSSQAAAAGIEAKGRISSGSGDVYLVAPNIGVDGNAVITSDGGNIVLAAGEMVEITGRNLNDITFAVQSRDNRVINLGTLSGGAVGVFAGTLSHSGVIQAQSLVNEGGRLVLKAGGNLTLAAGSKTLADGNTLAGTISIEAQAGNVSIDSGSLVSAQAISAATALQATPRGGNVAIRADAGVVSIERDALISVDGGRGGDVQVQSAKLVQDGAIQANGRDTLAGTISLKAGSRLIQSASAVVSAKGILRGGDIAMAVNADANSSAYLFTSATIDASAASGVGGAITISGRELTFAAAHLVANGDAGGGSMRVGGGRSGEDGGVPNARNVIASGATNFEASARVDGDGGNVVVWADGTNRFAGNLAARGGAYGGNGGFIEVSGKEQTQFGGLANAGAAHGQHGTFLIDPKYIRIQAPVFSAGVNIELLDPNPGSNDGFGQNLQVLSPSGNILVFKSTDDFAATNAGAIYLFDGTTGALLSNLRGSAANDQVGSGNIARFLGSGNFLVSSPLWSGSAGALTTFNPTTGVSGRVSAANSLVGTAAGDQIGSGGIQTLTGGKLVIFSPNWNSAAGAITWADGTSGISGVVSASNSLVGATSNDRVGNSGINVLAGAKYYVATDAWNSSAGAITWVDPTAPPVGLVSSTNSLVGSSANDHVGGGGVFNLGAGKSLIFSPNWSSDRGAVTWFDQAAGTVGVVGAGNSLVGSTAGDQVGSGSWDTVGSKIVINSPRWNNAGIAPSAGAMTWANPGAPIFGAVSATNSLVGSNTNDRVGDNGIEFIDGVHYAVVTPTWNGDRGAVTWIDSAALIVGAISAGNSLVGSIANDQVGSGGFANLGSGKSLVFSPNWSNGAATSAGAVTWFDNTSGSVGTVGSSNSLIGSSSNDQVGGFGNYQFIGSKIAIRSPGWNNTSTAASNAGAITWADPSVGITGAVSSANSLVGDATGDRVGSSTVQFLGGANYYVATPAWHSSAGAVTWINSAAPAVGAVGAGNSLVGSVANDQVGSGGIQNIGSGKSLVFSPNWDNGAATNAGAVTWFDQASGTFGAVGSSNSLIGSSTNDQVGGFGNYQFLGSKIAIRSPSWDNTSSAPNAGAITWATPSVGITGAVSSANSLVGDASGDQVGNSTVQVLSGANYFLTTAAWHGSAGAVTFINSAAPPVGVVSAGNSLVGSVANDRVGSGGVYSLGAGKHLVFSPLWNGSMGAVTWFDDAAGTLGVVGAGNSLIGSTAGDQVGSGLWDTFGSRIVILSPNWNNGGSAAAAGAMTWADAGSAMTGPVTAANSLVGGSTNDRVGNNGIDFLTGSLSVVRSTNWSGNAGAATWITNAAPLTGLVSSSNSLVGSSANDSVGSGGVSYGNGYEVLRSTSWNGNRGAVTWIAGTAPATGVVSSQNSLVGVNPNDSVGNSGVSFLANGDYYVRSTSFNNSAGAVSIGSAIGGISGVVSGANSLVGQAAGDGYGSLVTVLSGSRLLVRASNADSGGLTNNGRVHIYSGGSVNSVGTGGPLNAQTFNDNPSSSVTITPAQITAITNTGTAVVLQANSDITLEALSDILSDNPSGDGGDLTLQAGRSVFIKSNIVTDNGNLTIIGNDRTTGTASALSAARGPSVPSTNAVSAPDRDAGVAEITMANGTRLDTGNGNATINLRDGLGRSGAQAAAGDITLRSIKATNLSVVNDLAGIRVGDPAASLPSDIAIAGDATFKAATTIGFFGGPSGAFAQLSVKGTLSISPAATLVDGGSFARIVRPDSNARSGVLDTITAGLLSLNPNLLDQIEDTKRSKGEIEIEGGETCK